MKFTHKIMLMPLIAGIASLVLILIVIGSGLKNKEMINQLKNEYLQALEISNDLEKKALQIRFTLQNAATVSDEDMVAEAGEIQAEFQAQLEKAKSIPSIDSEKIDDLNLKHAAYCDLAKDVTIGMINGDFSDELFANVGTMNSNYNELINALADFNTFTKEQIDTGFIRTEKTRFQSNAGTVTALGLTIIIIGLVSSIVIKSVSNSLGNVSEVAAAVAKGDLTHSIKIEVDDQIGRLGSSINEMVDSLKENNARIERNLKMAEEVVTEVNHVAELQRNGNMSARASSASATGKYKDMVEGFNSALDSIISPIEKTIDVLEDYAGGNLQTEMTALPGDQVKLTNSMNSIRRSLNNLVSEGLMLSDAAEQGDLDLRGDVEKFKGDYAKIIQGMNSTVDNLLKPVAESRDVLQLMANGDLTSMVAGNYKGDHTIIKDALNDTISSLHEILSQVGVSADEVLGGAQQVSDSSQSLSQGATEQAASIQEVSASITQITGQTVQNSENANQAKTLAKGTLESAETGNGQMKRMLEAMGAINDSAGEISKIIKVIDEIAFQTNLLALNAAVEAARAGVHGKGFAVVAEEVRNLAQRSAKAAKETTELIEGSVQKAENGSVIARETSESLKDIVERITKVNDLTAEIAVSSDEQRTGIEQIAGSISQIDRITQENSSSAQEGAAASEELSSQANYLKQMIQRFQLNNKLGAGSKRLSGAPSSSAINLESQNGNESMVQNPDQIINLDDMDFGEF